MTTTAADVVTEAHRLFHFIRTPARELYALPHTDQTHRLPGGPSSSAPLHRAHARWAIGLTECTNRLCRLQGDRGRFSIFDD